jgi:hypothetical protein
MFSDVVHPKSQGRGGGLGLMSGCALTMPSTKHGDFYRLAHHPACFKYRPKNAKNPNQFNDSGFFAANCVVAPLSLV